MTVKLMPDIFKSLAVHLALLALLFLGKLSFDRKLKLIKDENLTLIESSVRVDVVAMPEMTIKELKAVEMKESSAKSAAPVEAKPIESDLEFVKEKKKQSFQDMMKRLSQNKVKVKKQKAKKQEGLGEGEDSTGSALSKLVLKGNKISAGTSVTGSQFEGEKSAFVEYASQIPAHVRPFWKLPSYLIDGELKCRVRIYLSKDGKLLKSEVFESSGNEEYDRRAVSAVKKASPFPRVPPEIIGRLTSGEIVLGFPL